MVNLMRKESFERAKKVKMIILDVDGTLTDGSLFIGESGELFKPFNCRDGLGIRIAQKAGIEIAIITGRASKQLLVRAQELQIKPEAIMQGHLDKRDAYTELKNKFNLNDEDIAYVGDDIIDLPVMVQVGFTGATANAVKEVKTRVCVVSDFNGGEGAVREVIEFILKAKGLWNGIVAEYLNPEPKEKEPFYLAANKSNQATPSTTPLRQPIQQPIRPQPMQPAQTPQINQQSRVTPTVVRPTISAAPAQKVQPQPTSTRPAIPTRPVQPQPSKDENLEKLDKIGQRLNTKF